MKVLIAGAGIAGLTAALSLARCGHQVEVHERNPDLNQGGAGILLAPNALRILEVLGVNYESCGQTVRRMQLLSGQGGVLQQIEIERIAGNLGATMCFHRQELHQALQNALPKSVKLNFNSQIFSADQYEADLLIGADGLRSTIRERLFGALRLRYSGTTCWRAVVENPGITEAFEMWAGDARVGAMPLTENRIYVFLVHKAFYGAPRQKKIEQFENLFSHLAEPVPSILHALKEQDLLHHDLEELPELFWGKGHVLLIGDAAHAMTPNYGQGAGMGIEDAAVLPQVIASSDPAKSLLRLRNRRVAKIKGDSRRFGEVAHWSSPIARKIRDRLIHLTPNSLSDKNYLQVIQPGMHLSAELSRIMNAV